MIKITLPKKKYKRIFNKFLANNKINKVDKSISKAYIDEVKADKKAGQVVSSLVKNAKMTPAEAKQAVAAVNEPKKSRGKSAPTNYATFGGIVRRKK